MEKISYLEKKLKEDEDAISALKQNSDIQSVINEIMQTSMLPLDLSEIQERILDIILNIPWLSLKKKGCIFLTVENKPQLKLVSQKNLSEPLLKMCDKVQFGQCLCGKAALTKKLGFKSCLDEEHTNRYKGMHPHGHYNVPILDRNNETLGVLNLYVKQGHQPLEIERNFLESTCKILAILIENKKLEEQLKKNALTDQLTGLSNRVQFMDDLKKMLARAKRLKKKVAVLFIDLDRFKQINDEFGHACGDDVLKQMADRLLKVVRLQDKVARIGGDEFVAAIELIHSESEAGLIIDRIHNIIEEPFSLNGSEVSITVSIGLAVFPDNAGNADHLIKEADEAMYVEKRKHHRK